MKKAKWEVWKERHDALLIEHLKLKDKSAESLLAGAEGNYLATVMQNERDKKMREHKREVEKLLSEIEDLKQNIEESRSAISCLNGAIRAVSGIVNNVSYH